MRMRMRMQDSAWLGAAFCLAALQPVDSAAAPPAPTAEELLAAQDAELESRFAEWVKGTFEMPGDLELDEDLRQAALQLAREHQALIRAQGPVWMAQERAASGNVHLRGSALSQPLFLRAINELALWSVESGGQAQDEAWLKAVLAPTACRSIPVAYFARRIALIQAAPVDVRPTLLAGERELLSRWGTKRQSLPPRPPAAQLEAAGRNIALLRAGLPVSAEPMSPFLAARVFDRKPHTGSADRWELCARSQWWLASQLAGGKTDRAAALAVYRYSTMVNAYDYLPPEVEQKAAQDRQASDGTAYPPAAAYFNLQGVTTVQAELDDQGKRLKAQVVSRKLTVPGVRDNPPLAFETLLDAAALELAEKRVPAAARAAGFKIDLVWRLECRAR